MIEGMLFYAKERSGSVTVRVIKKSIFSISLYGMRSYENSTFSMNSGNLLNVLLQLNEQGRGGRMKSTKKRVTLLFMVPRSLVFRSLTLNPIETQFNEMKHPRSLLC